MSEGDKIRSLVSETQARYSTAIGDLIRYSFAVKRENNELQATITELQAEADRLTRLAIENRWIAIKEKNGE